MSSKNVHPFSRREVPKMPKGKRRGRSDRNRAHDGSLQTSDDDSYNNDNVSVVSNNSEIHSTEDGEEAEELAQEQFEEKLIEIIDGLTQKSSQGRTNCLQQLSKSLIKKYMPAFVRERLFTLCDSIERCLKKGGNVEKGVAADLSALLCVQLGAEDACEDISKALKPILLVTACDNSVSPTVRAKCCVALGHIAFLSGGEMGDILLLMQQMENIYAGSYLKGDGSMPTISPEMAVLHSSALSAWTLLLTLMAPGNITAMTHSKNFPSLEQLSELLESPHLDVRMSAGEALALIFELGRMESDDFAEDFAMDLTDTLKQLATDSHKYRAKKDRKQQRATFRDILQFIENDSLSEVQVKFGKEVLLLDSWTRRKQYDSFCNILGPAINTHLAENDLLRDIFEIIGEPIQEANTAHAQDQMERYRKRLANAANFKARTLSRAKNRDKRSDF